MSARFRFGPSKAQAKRDVKLIKMPTKTVKRPYPSAEAYCNCHTEQIGRLNITTISMTINRHRTVGRLIEKKSR